MPVLKNNGSSAIVLGRDGVLEPGESQITSGYFPHADIQVVSDEPFATPSLFFAKYEGATAGHKQTFSLPVPPMEKGSESDSVKFPFKLSLLCLAGEVKVKYNVENSPEAGVITLGVDEFEHCSDADWRYIKAILVETVTAPAVLKIYAQR